MAEKINNKKTSVKEKDNDLSEIIKKIEKRFGPRSVFYLDNESSLKIPVISSGSILLDRALGGGYPKGRIIEIFGLEASGKTTLALIAIAEFQRQGLLAAFIDVEHAIDPNFAEKLGVDITKLILSQPDSGEQALEILSELVKTNQIGIVVVDSVAALTPEIELSGNMNDQTIGAQARLMSKALRKLAAAIANSKTVVLFINQVRQKIGVFFGNPEITPGGRALKFFSSIRIKVSRGELLKNGDEITGYQSNIKIVKNKIAAPFRTATITVDFNSGISKLQEIFLLACEKDIITKRGIWYYYKEISLGQGKTKAVEYLASHQNIIDEIKSDLF